MRWDFSTALQPPYTVRVLPVPDTHVAEPTPTISADIFDDLTGVDTSTIILVVAGDTIPDSLYEVTSAGDGWHLEYVPPEPITSSDSIWVQIIATDSTSYCEDNVMISEWAFVNMAERLIHFPLSYGAPCDTVDVPLIIDGLDRSWIDEANFVFRVDPEIAVPLDIVTDGSLTDGWSVDRLVIDPDSGTVECGISGTPLSGGPGGDLLYMRTLVRCNSHGGSYFELGIDTAWFGEGLPVVHWNPGMFIVELTPTAFTCDVRLNRTTGEPSEDFVVTFGAIHGGSGGYDPGLDVQYIPPPAWRVGGYFPLSDTAAPHISSLMRDIREVAPPVVWHIVTEAQSVAIPRCSPVVLRQREFRIDGDVDMKRDSVAYFGMDDTLEIRWTLPSLAPDSARFAPGWNLVSSPVLPEGIPAAEFFGTSLGVFRYNAESWGYDYADYVRDGEGYWVWAADSYSVPVAGSEIAGFRRPVSEGWNLIGATDSPLSVTDIATEPSGGIIDVYGWGGSIYTAADSLVPGHGYWLLSSVEGILHAPAGYRRRPGPIPAGDWSGHILSGETGLTLCYDSGAENGLQRGDVALPPIPPTEEPRRLSLVSGRVELSRDLSAGSWELLIREESELRFELPEYIILRSGNLEIQDGDVITLEPGNYKLSAESTLPEEFAILGCRPNPFNATTEIRVAIPEAGEVVAEIYDIGGRLLRSETRNAAAGILSMTWNGRDAAGRELPSGIYFARVSLGEECLTTKAVLLK